VLGFWRAVAAQRYRAAYEDLGPSLRQSLPYLRFAASAAGARTVFARIPHIATVDGTGTVRTVSVASSRGALARPDAVVFTVRCSASGGRIVSARGVA
jgi:hypothetical protein